LAASISGRRGRDRVHEDRLERRAARTDGAFLSPLCGDPYRCRSVVSVPEGDGKPACRRRECR